jgi:hypothetical protein
LMNLTQFSNIVQTKKIKQQKHTQLHKTLQTIAKHNVYTTIQYFKSCTKRTRYGV